MNELPALVRVVTRYGLFFFAACLFIWAMIPEIRTVMAGLVLGTVVSLINGRILAYKIQQMTQRVLENTGKPAGAGFVARISMSLIAVMVAIRFPQFDLVTTIIGLFFVQFATFGFGLALMFKKKL